MTAKQTRARRALLDSAVSLLADNPGASFIEIAEAAGVGRATLYRHFPTRDDLIRALSLEAIEATDIAARKIMSRAMTATDALRLMMEAMIPFGDRYYFLTRLPELEDDEVNAHLKRQNEELATLIREAQEEGGINPDIPSAWAAAVFNNLVYAAWSLQGTGELDSEQLKKLAVGTLRGGLG